VHDDGRLWSDRVRSLIASNDDQVVDAWRLVIERTSYVNGTCRVADAEQVPVLWQGLGGEWVFDVAVCTWISVDSMNLDTIWRPADVYYLESGSAIWRFDLR
jgi:hypothetical protein